MLAGLLAFAAGVSIGCCDESIAVPPPPRVEIAARLDPAVSTLRVPLTIPLDDLQAALERQVPRQLWAVNQQRRTCVSPRRVEALGVDLGRTPAIACRVTGHVTRGTIALAGDGQDLLIRLPVNARLTAQDAGGLLAGETATGTADATLRARLSVTPDWRVVADVDITYDWSREPGIDFLGQRVLITAQADRELASVVTQVERELERALARTPLRPRVAAAWRRGFTVQRLGTGDPAAWLRVAPRALGVGGWQVTGRQLVVDLAVAARTESVIGSRPATPPATPLPARASRLANHGAALVVPLVVTYPQMEDSILAELRRAGSRVTLRGLGPVSTHVSTVRVHATTGGRLAVGITARVTPEGAALASYGPTEGEVWLTAQPQNGANDPVVRLTDLTIAGDTNRATSDLIARTFVDENMRQRLERALVFDFTQSRTRALAQARAAAANLAGDGFGGSITLDDVHHAPLQVTGAGLVIPITASGTGQLSARVR
jgi:hypothetical protein